jgi:catechol 2,3-dioxygenase-like lactoylglutathione lyase family enzyme
LRGARRYYIFFKSAIDIQGEAMITGLQTIVLYVSDVERAARFYRDQLGLEQVYESKGRLALQCGPTRLFLHPTEDPERGPWNVELYFQVEDVDDAVSSLRAQGVGVLLEPTDEPWGERNAGILDPDGYPVYLTQSLEDSWIASSPAQPVTSQPNT